MAHFYLVWREAGFYQFVRGTQVAAHLALLHPFSPCLGLHQGREQEDLVQDALDL